ncbi:MAG: dienelactone hydrolase family protein [Armatimonadota bacterium]
MRTAIEKEIKIKTDSATLGGTLVIPENAAGIVIFAHGSGSSRFSPRNQSVASFLREMGLGTLLMDLLEPREAEDRSKVFDINLLAERLISATHLLSHSLETAHLPVGYFGASTGAAAALQAAAKLGNEVSAVVSRGGRPDLAVSALKLVKSPTLLIVGGNDFPIIPLNKQALQELNCPKELVIIPGATHLFEEPGALEEVARLTGKWFSKYMVKPCRGE